MPTESDKNDIVTIISLLHLTTKGSILRATNSNISFTVITF